VQNAVEVGKYDLWTETEPVHMVLDRKPVDEGLARAVAHASDKVSMMKLHLVVIV
jgi:hypothetical protein